MKEISPRALIIVFAGGASGTLFRALITWTFPIDSALPLATITVNLLGSLAIGVLAGYTAKQTGSERSRITWMFGGVGFLGGFTTYSALSLETVMLVSISTGLATVYALFNVLGGIILAFLGLVIASKVWPDRGVSGVGDPK